MGPDWAQIGPGLGPEIVMILFIFRSENESTSGFLFFFSRFFIAGGKFSAPLEYSAFLRKQLNRKGLSQARIFPLPPPFGGVM